MNILLILRIHCKLSHQKEEGKEVVFNCFHYKWKRSLNKENQNLLDS
jgi:hypothetical protein